jgi:penicillin amidase
MQHGFRIWSIVFTSLIIALAGHDLDAAQPAAEALLGKARSVLAQLDGSLHVGGLGAAVEVLRDRWGVPHIYARNSHDLFFAQGFVAAQDRLFQLDIWRRFATGETAEVTGPEGLPRDRFARLIRYRGDLDSEWRNYSPDARQIAAAFTEGINAYVDCIGDRLPVEFQLLGVRPGKWKAEDCLGRASVLSVVMNLEQEVARAELVTAVGIAAAHKLMPTDPPTMAAPADGLDLSGIDRDVLSGYKAAVSGLQFVRDGGGSNNWAVNGGRSASGKPMLAGDPHRGFAMPSLRYVVHLDAPGWNVIGAGEPALPGVAIGHNGRIAWAFTVVTTDQADLIVEETDPRDPRRYRCGDGWQAMEVLHQQVRIRGGQPVDVELCFTRHGPVIHEDRQRRRAYALRWVGAEPGTAAYLASLAVDRAGNWPQFRDAAARWKTPALNLTYADVDGNIGWIAAGLTPIRAGYQGLLPVPGAGDKYAWRGFLSVEQYPQKLNPPEGFIVTANHDILPPGYTREISYEWAAPYRYQRLLEDLREKPRFDLNDFQRMQYDNVSIPVRRLVALLDRAGAAEPELVPFYRLLSRFDGRMDRSSAAAALCGCWVPKLAEAYYGSKAPRHLLPRLFDRLGQKALFDCLDAPTEEWFGPDAIAKRDALLRSTFAAAVREVRRRLGNDPRRWQWGRIHTVTFRHPLGKWNADAAALFSRGPFPAGSDGFAPNQSSFNERFEAQMGATYRQVFDLADWDRGRATSAPGQSGQPGSPYYDNLIAPWEKGEYFPLAFSRKKVEEVAAHRLLLLPGQFGSGGRQEPAPH